MRAAELIRSRRLANGLTQAQLARRAGTTQAAISRLESGRVSPTVEMVERLLFVMGEELDLRARRGEHDYDRRRLAAQRRRPPAERLELALNWNRLASEFARAGRKARDGSA